LTERRIKRLFLVAASALMASTFGVARAQTVYGPGELLVHPTAFVPSAGDVRVNVSEFAVKGDDGNRTWVPASIAISPTGGFQIGAVYINENKEKDSGGVFGKYQLMKDSLVHPAIAIAGSVVSGGIKESSVSLVASHRFSMPVGPSFTLHGGIQWAQRSDLPSSKDDTVAYFGGEVAIAPSISFVAEADTKFNFNKRSATALGIKWSGPLGSSVAVGWVNEGRSSENTFFVGVGYRIGGNR
jgi:hypothetical protein